MKKYRKKFYPTRKFGSLYISESVINKIFIRLIFRKLTLEYKKCEIYKLNNFMMHLCVCAQYTKNLSLITRAIIGLIVFYLEIPLVRLGPGRMSMEVNYPRLRTEYHCN